MITYNRTPTALVGTPESPSSIAPGASAEATLPIESAVSSALIAAMIIIGDTSPGLAPTVQFSFTLDGTNYIQDAGGPYSCSSIEGVVTPKSCIPPLWATGARITISNPGTAAISAWAQASIVEETSS